MKLYLQPGTVNWSPERYHYAAEQMMLTLFPGERPEYPEDNGHSLDRDNAAVFSLAVEGETARLAARSFVANSPPGGRAISPPMPWTKARRRSIMWCSTP